MCVLAGGRTYSHLKGGCSWADYINGSDYTTYSSTGSTVSGCAAACDANITCTGFEIANSGAYCSFWFNAACSGPLSNGWHAPSLPPLTSYFTGKQRAPTTTVTSYFTATRGLPYCRAQLQWQKHLYNAMKCSVAMDGCAAARASSVIIL